MKELWSILMEKLRLVEPIYSLIAIGIIGMFTIGMATIIITEFFFLITQIVAMSTGHPVG
jgi:hypothetical protein